jgi:hypothetical protein
LYEKRTGSLSERAHRDFSTLTERQRAQAGAKLCPGSRKDNDGLASRYRHWKQRRYRGEGLMERGA